MRAIKFRGKKEKGSEWLFYDLINTSIGETMPCEFQQYILDPNTIGQMWILNDELEIYTDDLFTAICSPSGTIAKKERLCKVGFGGRGLDISIWHKGEWWAYGYMDFTSIKIVGNIHDNPELLK